MAAILNQIKLNHWGCRDFPGIIANQMAGVNFGDTIKEYRPSNVIDLFNMTPKKDGRCDFMSIKMESFTSIILFYELVQIYFYINKANTVCQ